MAVSDLAFKGVGGYIGVTHTDTVSPGQCFVRDTGSVCDTSRIFNNVGLVQNLLQYLYIVQYHNIPGFIL